MKPINDKERTVAYFQFLVLSILFIVVWTVAVFFDYKIKAKDYEVLKKENKRLKGSMVSSSQLRSQIDSLTMVVLSFKTMTETDYNDKVKRFSDDLSHVLAIEPNDTSELNMIKIGILKTFKEWSYSMGASIRELNKNDLVKEKINEIKALNDKYTELSNQFELYKDAHPY